MMFSLSKNSVIVIFLFLVQSLTCFNEKSKIGNYGHELACINYQLCVNYQL